MSLRLEGLDRLALEPGARVGLAASGGRDSTALVHAAKAQLEGAVSRLVVIHVDHALRGEASDADRRAVAAQAAALGLPCHIAERPVAREAPGSLEARARAARYDAFLDAARQERLTHLLLAHHRDDQVESVVLRLLRGSGPRGLSGMPASRPLAPEFDTLVVRPLLEESRQSLAAYCADHGLSWREDASNADLGHRRNAVRRVLLPRLREADPAIDAELLDLAARARAVAHRLEALAAPLRPALAPWRTGDCQLLDAVGLASLPEDLAFTVVQGLVTHEEAFSGADLARLADRLAPRPDPASCTLSKDREATRCGRWLLIHGAPPPVTPRALQSGELACDRGGRLRVRRLADGDAVAQALEAARADSRCAVVADVVLADLRLRAPEAGDRMRALGAPGSKLLADLLSGRGIPRPLRCRLPVVVDARGPLWVPGCPPAERARVAAGASEAVALTWLEAPPLAALGR